MALMSIETIVQLDNGMFPKIRSVRRLRVAAGLLALAAALPVLAQTPMQSTEKTKQPVFVIPGLLPSVAREYLFHLGDRIQKSGKERMVLNGTFTDRSGRSTSAQLIWQLPGEIWFNRAQPGDPLVYSITTGLVNAANISSADSNVLESLLDDSAETFLYGFQRGHAYRLIGLRYRADDGTSPNYRGPWYDVYIRAAPVLVQQGTPVREKVYLFDSQTQLLAKVEYTLPNSTKVTTEFSNWTQNGGQSFPGQIVRRENSAVAFTFNITNHAVTPYAKDGLFPGE
jgi:hypothetical protein